MAIDGSASPRLASANQPLGISWEADGTLLYGQLDGVWQVSEHAWFEELKRLVP